jgi:hypothetical protein
MDATADEAELHWGAGYHPVIITFQLSRFANKHVLTSLHSNHVTSLRCCIPYLSAAESRIVFLSGVHHSLLNRVLNAADVPLHQWLPLEIVAVIGATAIEYTYISIHSITVTPNLTSIARPHSEANSYPKRVYEAHDQVCCAIPKHHSTHYNSNPSPLKSNIHPSSQLPTPHPS